MGKEMFCAHAVSLFSLWPLCPLSALSLGSNTWLFKQNARSRSTDDSVTREQKKNAKPPLSQWSQYGQVHASCCRGFGREFFLWSGTWRWCYSNETNWAMHLHRNVCASLIKRILDHSKIKVWLFPSEKINSVAVRNIKLNYVYIRFSDLTKVS